MLTVEEMQIGEIEHGKETPPKNINAIWAVRYRAMLIGDSFEVHTGSLDAKLIRKRLASAASFWGRRHNGIKFETRVLDNQTVFVKRIK